MRLLSLALAAVFALALPALAAPAKKREPSPHTVARLAPDLSFPGAGNKNRSLRSLRGQPVILLIADSPRTRAFRKQLDRLPKFYSQFASRQTVFIAAFKEGEGPVKSDLPFVVANNGPGTAANYDVQDKFNILIIGRDGNIDYQTDQILKPERIRDVLQNSYSVQKETRRDLSIGQ